MGTELRISGAGVLELDAPLHPGLSGGPVLDGAGALVGMVIAAFGSEIHAMAVTTPALRDLRLEVRGGATRRVAACGDGP